MIENKCTEFNNIESMISELNNYTTLLYFTFFSVMVGLLLLDYLPKVFKKFEE